MMKYISLYSSLKIFVVFFALEILFNQIHFVHYLVYLFSLSLVLFAVTAHSNMLPDIEIPLHTYLTPFLVMAFLPSNTVLNEDCCILFTCETCLQCPLFCLFVHILIMDFTGFINGSELFLCYLVLCNSLANALVMKLARI